MQYAMAVGTSPLADAGNFYLGHSQAFRTGHDLISCCTMMIPLPPARTCDVNTPEDWTRAEQLYEAIKK
jgi:N-acylneuraminate cytidylyltransferase